MQRIGTLRHALTATLPSPTMVRSVSGNDTAITNNHVPEQTTRNTNIDRQPRLALRAAAMTGPTLGAESVHHSSVFPYHCLYIHRTKKRPPQRRSPSRRAL